MSARRPAEETARLGTEIYERDIRPRLRQTHHGEYVAIDVDSGHYAVADTRLAAAERLLDQHPDAAVWLERVGHRAVVSIGGGSTLERDPQVCAGD
ncbi:MAG: hypothetical protein OXC06_09975 [Acidimicrobiaceae bacterium]|nr:hypothetical protein [Acidimicrobiaceae bacterium]